MKNNETTTAKTTTAARVVGERLQGNTLDGELKTVIKRHTLKAESKCAMIKRLLCTKGMTREKLIELVEKEHGELKESTLNTVRADLKRTLGTGELHCTGWRTDGKAGKLATAAVAKLRTAELGTGYASVELVRAAAESKAAAESGSKGKGSAGKVQAAVSKAKAAVAKATGKAKKTDAKKA